MSESRFAIEKDPRLRLTLIFVFFIFSSLYFISSRSSFNSNDGSQFALAASSALEGRFSINSYFEYTERWDHAYRDGNYYSDRAPGTSFVAAPFIWLGTLEAKLAGKDSVIFAAREYALLLPAILGAASIVIMILLLMRLGVTRTAAFLTALSFGLGSLHWKYSALFMSHVPAEFLVISLLYLLIRDDFFSRPGLQIFAAFIFGMMPLVRYELLLLMPFYLFILWRMFLERSTLQASCNVAGIITAFLIPIAAGAFYHTACFGAPWKLFNSFYAPSRNFWDTSPYLKVGGQFAMADMFQHSLFDGLKTIFVSWPGTSELHVNKVPGNPGAWGFFILQPILIPALAGWYFLSRRSSALALALFSMVLVITVVSSLNLSVDGGMMRDPRYMLVVLPLMFLPLGFILDKLLWFERAEVARAIYYLLTIWGLIFCAIHAIETFGWDGRFEFKSAISSDSLISHESFDAIVFHLLQAEKALSPQIALLAIVTALLALSIWKPIISKPFSILSTEFVRYPVIILAPALLWLCLLTAYAWVRGDNAFGNYADTLKIDNVPVALAAQEYYYPKFTASAKLVIPNGAPEKNCRRALLVHSPSVVRFKAPPSDIFFSAWIGVPQSLLDRAGADIFFEIWQNKEMIWRSPPVNKNSPTHSVTTPIAQATETELRVTSANGEFVPAVWCDTLLSRIPPPQEMF